MKYLIEKRIQGLRMVFIFRGLKKGKGGGGDYCSNPVFYANKMRNEKS